MTTIILSLILGIVVFTIGYIIFRPLPKTKGFKEFNDDLLYDPDTGAKITLEQAEAGYWEIPDEDTIKQHRSEQVDKTMSDDVATFEMAQVLEKEGYVRKKFSDSEVNTLESLVLLNIYSDWDHKEDYVYIKDEVIVFFPVVRQSSFKTISYTNIQLMFWIKIKAQGGHYYFIEKTFPEKILSFLIHDKFRLKNYKSMTIKNGNNQSFRKIVEKFDSSKELEMEITDNNFFIKTLRQPNTVDYDAVKGIINSIKHINV